ncbi:Shedu anti-phage system protein SduA domain-containing protein [Delftia acidovorans]
MSSVVPMLGFLQKKVRTKLGFEGDEKLNKGAAIRSIFKKNPRLAEFYTGLLILRVDTILEEEHLPSIEDCLGSIEDLERLPLKSHTFASLFWNRQHLGIIVFRHELKGGGFFYELTLMTHDDGLDLAIRAEIRAARAQPEPFASIFSSDGWSVIPREQISSVPELALMIQVVFALHRQHYPKLLISKIASADIGPNGPPNENRELIKLCSMAMQGKVQCTRVTVPLDAVVPKDISYALNYPLEEIRRLRDAHVDGGRASSSLLLYQRGGKLIMDDDYSAFLSYKSLSFKRVPAVVLGKFHAPNTEVLETGGGELIPPILVERRSPPTPSTPEDDAQRLEWRLQLLKPSNPTASQTLSKVYFDFCHLLERRRKREADLHAFLLQHPVVLDAHAAGVHSEVHIGRYRADLVLRYEQSDKRILLVELERDNDKIFKKNNRLMDKVAHASQQVEDWIAMIRGNAPEMPAWLKGAYVPEGLVVIGRSTQLTIDQKETLFNINSNRLVKIVTYDDLLERLNRLIVSMENS